MKFIVLLKQVPESSEIRFDRNEKRIVRSGVKNVINPYDRRAISEAIRYKNEKGAEVVAVTMGPPQAQEVLREALLMGADRGVLIEDSALAGSDTLVTAHVLAAAARKIGFDLILCGQSSTDSETGQVPPELGELLGIPCAAAVRKIQYGDEEILVQCEIDEGIRILNLPLPAIVSTAERLIKPIKLKDADTSQVSMEKIQTMRLSDLRISGDTVGEKGSPTWVDEIQDRSVSRSTELWDASHSANIAAEILSKIQRVAKMRLAPASVPVSFVKGERRYWCWMERYQDSIRNVSLELLCGAASLAAITGGEVMAIGVGSPLSSSEIQMLSSYGADEIYYAHASSVHPDEVVSLLCERVVSAKPYALFFPATSQGRLLAPRVAARLQLGLTGDCVGLEIDASHRLTQLKPAFGGNIVARIFSKTYPQLATVRPGALDLLMPRLPKQIPVTHWTFPYNAAHQFQILDEIADAGAEAARLDSARIVVCVGMGLKQENVTMAFQLAEALDGAIGATRRVVDSGWLPRQFQIGLTGKFVAPDLYLGLGVGGRYNHTIGIQKAGNIIAINNDPNAQIFQNADIGVIGDCVEITRQMLKLLESA